VGGEWGWVDVGSFEDLAVEGGWNRPSRGRCGRSRVGRRMRCGGRSGGGVVVWRGGLVVLVAEDAPVRQGARAWGTHGKMTAGLGRSRLGMKPVVCGRLGVGGGSCAVST